MLNVTEIKLNRDEKEEHEDWNYMILELEECFEMYWKEGYAIQGEAEDIVYMVFEHERGVDHVNPEAVEKTMRDIDEGNCINAIEVHPRGTLLTIRYIGNY